MESFGQYQCEFNSFCATIELLEGMNPKESDQVLLEETQVSAQSPIYTIDDSETHQEIIHYHSNFEEMDDQSENDQIQMEPLPRKDSTEAEDSNCLNGEFLRSEAAHREQTASSQKVESLRLHLIGHSLRIESPHRRTITFLEFTATQFTFISPVFRAMSQLTALKTVCFSITASGQSWLYNGLYETDAFLGQCANVKELYIRMNESNFFHCSPRKQKMMSCVLKKIFHYSSVCFSSLQKMMLDVPVMEASVRVLKSIVYQNLDLRGEITAGINIRKLCLNGTMRFQNPRVRSIVHLSSFLSDYHAVKRLHVKANDIFLGPENRVTLNEAIEHMEKCTIPTPSYAVIRDDDLLDQAGPLDLLDEHLTPDYRI